ncbi:alpha/beta hydrolase [Microvirga massiliensis]|uniref:alpha/beta hydrolase n=1 Tax=Microvirga massiliensis TaxID=1033741 RepID=UPI0009E2F318|nr:alpha/beta fold hydrolase [Microvirga massiliensis]
MLRTHLIAALTAAALTALAAFPSVGTAGAAPKLVTEEFMIAADPGTQLFVRNKRPEDTTQFAPERTLLFVHGATLPSEATFDFPLAGLSWMDFIAQHGWDVYLVDVRGYGRSTRPPEMDQPAASNPPVATTDVAVKDVGSAIDFILRRRGLSKLTVMGWSWGTVIVGAYTADHNDKVERLVLYAPVWLQSAPPAATASRPSGAYIAAPPKRERLQIGAPDDRKSDLMPGFDAWSAVALATDPVGSKQNPPVLRSPAGVWQDFRDYWDIGKPYYDPARIKVPTLVIVAEWDGLTPPEQAQALFHKLPSGSDKRFVEIGEGTHLVMLEKNRMQLFREVQFFLDQVRQPN